MREFSLKEGKLRGGLFSAIGGAVKYVVVPVVIFTMVAAFLAALNGLSDNLGLSMVSDLRNAALILGIPIIFLSFFRGFYPRGSHSRMTFALLTTVMVGIWIWFVMRGGQFQLSATRAELNMDISPLVLLFIFAAALGGLYYVAEMFSYRKEFLEKRTALAPAPGQQPVAEQPRTEGTPAVQVTPEQPTSPASVNQSQKGSP
jgi:hypothetical protein